MSTLANLEEHPVVATAQESLRASGYTCLNRIECQFDDGTLILSGMVASYYQKQVAQSAVMKVDGVERLVNQIEVRKSSR